MFPNYNTVKEYLGGNIMNNQTGRIENILNIKYPMIQAPLAWLTNAELVAASGDAGILGILGPNAGQNTLTRSVEETADRMRDEIIKTKNLTSKPFAVTLIVSGDLTYTNPIVDAVIEEHVPVVLINGILNEELFKRLKDNGIKIVYRPLTPTIKDAKAAEKMGADIYVATGFDEGGTVPEKIIGTFSIVPMIADAISIPVMAAGGISDIRGVRAALDLGAEGVYVGSRFLVVNESPAAQNVKELIANSTAEDLKIFRTNPAYYRSLPGNLANKLVDMSESGKSRDEIAKVQKGTLNMKLGMLEGDTDNGFVSVGTGISLIHEIKSVDGVVKEMMADFIKS